MNLIRLIFLNREDLALADNLGGTCGQNGFQDVCLLTALQSLGLPASFDRNGPFPVSSGNTLLLPLGLQLCNLVQPKSLPDGKYIVHDAQKARFFEVQVLDGWRCAHLSLQCMCHGSLGRQELYLLPILRGFDTLCAHSVALDSIGGTGHAFKKPAAAPSAQTYTCPLDKCPCEGCDANLIYHLSVDAVLYGLGSPVSMAREQKNCTSRACQAAYGYNYRWEAGEKVNVLRMDNFQDEILFVNAKKAFSLKYLQYHEELLFRGHLSSAAIESSYHVVHGASAQSWIALCMTELAMSNPSQGPMSPMKISTKSASTLSTAFIRTIAQRHSRAIHVLESH